MNDDPIISYDGDIPGLEATKPAKGEKVDKKDKKVKDYEEYLEDEQDEALADAGVAPDAKIQSYKYALSGFSAVLTAEQAADLDKNSKVAVVRLDELQQIDTENSGTFLGLNAEESIYDAGYTGEGVIIGVIDTGI